MSNYDLTYEGSEVQGILDTGEKLKADGYILMGGATPSTLPGTPTKRVAYIGGPGSYSNFGTTTVVPSGSIGVFKYTGSAWSNDVIACTVPISTSLQNNDTTVPTGKAVKTVTDAIANHLNEGYIYIGIATTATNPGTPTGKVFYIATAAGTYTNFGSLAVTQGINVLKFSGSTWSVEQLWGVDDTPTAGSNKLVKSGGVQNELALGAVYDVSAKNPTAGPNNDGKWESLSALLSDANLSNLIPTAYRKGGMSIKFVQSSDNNYVQFRCIADEFTTDTTQWVTCVEGTYIESPEFKEVWTENEGKIILGVRPDGSIYFGAGVPPQIIEYINRKIEELSLDEYEDIVAFLNGIEFDGQTLQQLLNAKVDKVTGKSLIDSDYAESMSVIENPEYSDIETDPNKKVLGGRRKDGTKVEYVGFEANRIKTDELKAGGYDVVEYMQSHDGNVKYHVNRFVQFSDCHFRDDGVVQNGVDNDGRMALLVGMIEKEQEKGLDFVVCTGDNVIARYNAGIRVNELPLYKEAVIDKITVPFFPVVGNHDAFTDEEWYAAFGRPKQYSASIGNMFLIVLNVYHGSEEWNAPEHIPGSQMEEEHRSGSRDFLFTTIDNTFLEEQLKIATRLHKIPVVAMHTWETAGSLDVAAAEASKTRCIQLLNYYKCRLRLFGHSHQINNTMGTLRGNCNPGWFGVINDYNYGTSPWAINVFEHENDYLVVKNKILAHNYVDTPRLGNVPASITTLNLWEEANDRATYNYD